MSVFVTAALATLLLPPFALILLALVGVMLLRRRHRLGSALILLAIGTLAILSTPWVGERLLRSLESPALALPAAPGTIPGKPQAIVILGAGLDAEAPEYGGDTANRTTLQRLRHGARLHRRTGLPLLVSGGRPFGSRLSEADTMRDALQADFQVELRWIEPDSRNTRENAELSRAVLARASIDRILLVTHAWHMQRAQRAFERAGFIVVPAPTGFASLTPVPLAWVPNASALLDTRVALREWLGEAWYRLNSVAFIREMTRVEP